MLNTAAFDHPRGRGSSSCARGVLCQQFPGSLATADGVVVRVFPSGGFEEARRLRALRARSALYLSSELEPREGLRFRVDQSALFRSSTDGYGGRCAVIDSGDHSAHIARQ